jgi:hypothetical protein
MVCFDFRDGNVTVKNPDEPTIAKMQEFAQKLGAHLQGDDGEVYPAGGAAPFFPRPSLVERMRRWFGQRTLPTQEPMPAYEPPFAVGDRVRCVLRGEGTVVAIERKGGGVLDTVTVRFDDGSTHVRSLMASGLDRIRQEDG